MNVELMFAYVAWCSYSLADTSDEAPSVEPSSSGAAGVPSRPCAEVELRVVSRDDGGTVLYRELLPLRGLEVTTGSAQAQRQAVSHDSASQSRRPVFPSELHLLSDAAGGVTGQEGLPILFAVSPKVCELRAFLHACSRGAARGRGCAVSARCSRARCRHLLSHPHLPGLCW